MSKKTIEYEVRVHSDFGFGPNETTAELEIVLQRSDDLERMIQFALQIFASTIVKLVTVAEVVDGEFSENKVSLCR